MQPAKKKGIKDDVHLFPYEWEISICYVQVDSNPVRPEGLSSDPSILPNTSFELKGTRKYSPKYDHRNLGHGTPKHALHYVDHFELQALEKQQVHGEAVCELSSSAYRQVPPTGTQLPSVPSLGVSSTRED